MVSVRGCCVCPRRNVARVFRLISCDRCGVHAPSTSPPSQKKYNQRAEGLSVGEGSTCWLIKSSRTSRLARGSVERRKTKRKLEQLYKLAASRAHAIAPLCRPVWLAVALNTDDFESRILVGRPYFRVSCPDEASCSVAFRAFLFCLCRSWRRCRCRGCRIAQRCWFGRAARRGQEASP